MLEDKKDLSFVGQKPKNQACATTFFQKFSILRFLDFLRFLEF